MTKQLSKIQSFVASVVNNDFSEGQQSMILSVDLEIVGGKNGTCENANTLSCSGRNGTCVNNVSTCGSKNGECKSSCTTLKPKDDNSK